MNAPASREQVEAAVREWMHENRLSAARNATSLTDMICHMLAAQRTPPGEGSLAEVRAQLTDVLAECDALRSQNTQLRRELARLTK